MKKLLTCSALISALLLEWSMAPALANDSLLLSQDLKPNGMGGAEYVSGNMPGVILMPVNLWGAVGKPGIHHVPLHTDLVTLLSWAGGPGADAELDDVTIKRRTGSQEEVYHVNANDLLTHAGVFSPTLEANDIVIVPREKPAISNNTMTILTFATGILSLVLAAVVISNNIKH